MARTSLCWDSRSPALTSASTSRAFRPHEKLPSDVLPPDGALASAYYSIALLLGLGKNYVRCMRKAGNYVDQAMRNTAELNDNLLAIRGSIRLRFGYVFSAVTDFEEMLHLRETRQAPPNKIGDALMHVGLGHLSTFRFLKGRDFLKKSVELLARYPNDPNLPRARRKLALAYRLTGRLGLAREMQEQANQDAERLGALDQLDR